MPLHNTVNTHFPLKDAYAVTWETRKIKKLLSFFGQTSKLVAVLAARVKG